MVTISAKNLLGIYEELINCVDDPIDLPTEAMHLLCERNCFEELTLTDAEQQQLDQLDDELVKRWEVLAEVLPYPAPHPRRQWWWFLHEGPQVREEAKALAQAE